MTVFRCEWCGRFYSSSLPEGSACPNHIHEHNAKLQAQIDRFNERMLAGHPLYPALSCRINA